MILYTKNGSYPATLPNRIIFSSGLSRTNPSTFTPEEIADAGYIAVTQPDYNAETEQLSWDGTQFTVVSLPSPIPQPDWDMFNLQIFSNQRFNEVYGLALQRAPVATSALPTAVDQITTKGFTLFGLIFPQICSLGEATENDKIEWAELASSANLPQEFINIVRGTNGN